MAKKSTATIDTATQALFTLKKAASRSGGDRYTGSFHNADTGQTDQVDFYIPQSISRADDGASAPSPKLKITIEVA